MQKKHLNPSNSWQQTGRIRIIGGKWRSRLIKVPALPDLRPTPERLRETLFNWLLPFLHNASCLDVFAGTGILGFESLSRGASSVTMIEQQRVATVGLYNSSQTLGPPYPTIISGNAYREVHREKFSGAPFNIVFLDPPYRQQMTIDFFMLLQNFLQSEAIVYLESSRHNQQIKLPNNWKIMRTTNAGDALGRLYTVTSI